ncbi:MAG: T9SS type A sorting domain-containing protein [Saprospiraceae bacterium]|nr:T9SS type A sorting domain-containing protein [Saprospiraceae bacterium]
MKSRLIIVFLFVFAGLQAQLPKIPYQPIQFENILPDWYFTSGSEVFKSPYYDEFNKLNRNSFQEINVEGDHLYNLFKVHGRDQEGAYLEKVDLNSGNQKWFTYFDLTTGDRQEVPVLMRIKSGEYIELLSQKLNVPFSTENDLYLSGTDMSVVYRKYDDGTGALIEEIIPDSNDTLSLRTQHSFFPRGNDVSYFFSEDDGNFRYIERLKFGNKFKFKSYKIDKRGYVLSKSDTIDIGRDEFNAILLPKGKDTLVYLNFKTAEKQAYLQFFDYEMNKVDEKPLENFTTNFSILFREANENHILVQYIEQVPMAFDSLVIMAYDYNGNLLNTLKIEDNIYDSAAYKYIDTEDEFLMLESRYQEDAYLKREIRVIKTENGNKIVKKSFSGTDSLRTFAPYSFYITNDNIIISMDEGAYYLNEDGKFKQDIFAQALSTMSVPLEQLGLVSSNKDLPEDVLLSLYPNPAHDYLHFSGQGIENSDRWEIYDLRGHLVKSSSTIENNKEQRIEIRDLIPGMYFVSFRDRKTHQLYSKRFFKM